MWINFKPRGLQAGDEGKAWLEADLVFEDAEHRVILRRERVVNHLAPPPAPPLSAFVSVYLDLPAGYPAGTYTVRLLARDKFGGVSAAVDVPFEVAD